MKDVLNRIVDYKRKELTLRKKKYPNLIGAELKHKFRCQEALRNDELGIISEFKRRSPSKPSINLNASVTDVVNGYVSNGAAMISVLNDSHFFGAHEDDLSTAVAHSKLPILQKDFIVDVFQIDEASKLGASCILLIAAVLTKEEIKIFSRRANELGLDVLYEIHGEEELEKIDDSIKIVGINNRNLQTFEVDYEHSIRLKDQLPPGLLKISESGLSDPKIVAELKNEGFDGFLIGEQFMKQDNPGMYLSHFISQVKKCLDDN